MPDLWKADIFFVVTTLAVIVAAAVFLTLAFYAWGILKEARLLVSRLRAETDQLAHDLQSARERVSNEGWLTLLLGQWHQYQRHQSKKADKGNKGK